MTTINRTTMPYTTINTVVSKEQKIKVYSNHLEYLKNLLSNEFKTMSILDLRYVDAQITKYTQKLKKLTTKEYIIDEETNDNAKYYQFAQQDKEEHNDTMFLDNIFAAIGSSY